MTKPTSKFRVGDMVCHYEQRQPLQVVRVAATKSTQQIKVFLNNNDVVDGSNSALVFYPQKGDRVVVAVGPFTRWYWRQVATFPCTISDKGFKSYTYRKDREWMERYNPDEFPFGDVFSLDRMRGDLCEVYGEGQKFTVEISCLEVLERVRNGSKQPVKSGA